VACRIFKYDRKRINYIYISIYLSMYIVRCTRCRSMYVQSVYAHVDVCSITFVYNQRIEVKWTLSSWGQNAGRKNPFLIGWRVRLTWQVDESYLIGIEKYIRFHDDLIKYRRRISVCVWGGVSVWIIYILKYSRYIHVKAITRSTL
jgi:hypothetical protein